MLSIRALHPDLARKAKKELNEDPERIAESIKIVREWIKAQPHLKSRTDDQFLLTFLRASKHSIERTKQKIDRYYTTRTAIPELFKNRDLKDPKIFEVLNLGTGLVLPKTLGESGPRIILVRPGAYNPEKYNIYEVVRPGSLAADIQLIEDDNLIVAGLIEIIDLAGVTMAHLFQSDAVFMKKIIAIGGEASPLRNVGTHFINTPPTFETFFNLFKNVLSATKRNRVFLHGDDLSSLFEHIPQEYLPEEYGGTNGTTKEIVEFWEKKIMAYNNYFIEDEQYGTTEELRVNKTHFIENLFGVDGTFRSLNVD